ncbi:MAG: T9SS type A sorting domain-containing protein, partial [Calditrichota bacterium]
GKIQIYPGDGTSFSPDPGWQSATSSVIEAFALRDLDQDGRVNVQESISINRDMIHVFYLNEQSVEKVNSVRKNSVILNAGTDYITMPGVQWISTVLPLVAGDQIDVDYTISHDRDLVITNWDTNIGNYIFYNTTNPTGITTAVTDNRPGEISIYPNPFNSCCKFRIQLEDRSEVQLEIYDVTGRSIRSIYNGEVNPGKLILSWDGMDSSNRVVGSGMYFYQLSINNKLSSGRLLLLK